MSQTFDMLLTLVIFFKHSPVLGCPSLVAEISTLLVKCGWSPKKGSHFKRYIFRSFCKMEIISWHVVKHLCAYSVV